MNRILCYFLVASVPVLAQTPLINQFPSREFGQPQLVQSLISVAPNLAEGREVYGPNSIAVDNSASPPILYVADTFNNRVLAFQNPDSFTKCTTAGASTCGQASSKVIGQQDLMSTLPGGAGRSSLSAGLYLPTSVAVDSNGNLYVADSGNNRILRFPAPFKQTGALLATDLVIGQQSVTTGTSPNQGSQAPSAKSLYFFGGSLFTTGLAIEPSTGNLWVSDPGNNRVLQFPTSQLQPNTQQPAANIVLGQTDFTSRGVLPTPQGINSSQLYKNSLNQPSGLTFDQTGGLYVADGYSRVLYYVGPFVNDLAARRILGVNLVPAAGQPPAAYPNQFTLGNTDVNGNCCLPPDGVFTNGTNLFVADTSAHRIVVYDIPANWPAETATQFSPPILGVIGQSDKTSGKVNKGLGQADAGTLSSPVAGAFLGTELWVADAGNHRILGYPQLGPLTYGSATRLIGQLDFIYNAPNLIEGREVFFGVTGAGLAIDNSSSPPHLYIADTLNNRILGFTDARKVGQGSVADIVIGQPNFFSSVVNYPTGDPAQPSASSLVAPTGLAVDATGNLYVADSGNGRVLRFPTPFTQAGTQTANLVLGQSNFTSKIRNPSSQNMGTPWGVGLVIEANATVALAVSDASFNRVLVFKRSSGDFTNGQSATIVLGQSNFSTTTAAQGTSTTGPSVSGMNGPRHLAIDSSERLYVTDSGNNRVLIFSSVQNRSNGDPASFPINNLSAPQGIFVSGVNSGNTGEIWVTNTGGDQVIRYPEYTALISGTGAQPTNLSFQTNTLAVTLDSAGNPIVAEAANRVAFLFPQLTFQNPASYNQQPLAPGMLAILYRMGKDFNFTPVAVPSLPWGPVLGDLQVTVNGIPAPVVRIDTIDLLIQVPSTAPTSGLADFVVSRASTGEIIAAASLSMAKQSPAFFTSNAQGTGNVAAFLKDSSVMSQSNPVVHGDYVSFCLTGLGTVPNQPPDGTIATSSAPMPSSNSLTVASTLGGDLTPNVIYSGLGCGFPGGWQLIVTMPSNAQAGTYKIGVILNDSSSSIGPNGQLITTSFWIK